MPRRMEALQLQVMLAATLAVGGVGARVVGANAINITQTLVYITDPAFGTRQFVLYVPAGYIGTHATASNATQKAAVVLLHGQGLSPYYMSHLANFAEMLVQRNWVGVAAFGTSANNRTGAARHAHHAIRRKCRRGL